VGSICLGSNYFVRFGWNEGLRDGAVLSAPNQQVCAWPLRRRTRVRTLSLRSILKEASRKARIEK